MKLTIREAATIMGVSPRTLRARVARGELPGKKDHGVWTIERHHLPLTEAQRRALQRKADSLRRAVDDALPSRNARRLETTSRSIVDLAAFRQGANLVAEIRAGEVTGLAEPARQELLGILGEALLSVAEAAHQYDRELKLEAVNRARAGLGRAAGALALAAGPEPNEPIASWLAALEGEVLPAVAGFARWTDRLRKGRR